MELVDEEDDPALGVRDLLDDRLEPLLELSAKLGAGDDRSHVEAEQTLAPETLGYLPGGDPLGEAFDDRRLADTGFPDEDGVVLRPARQHLAHPPDLLVAADHGIELAAAREIHEIPREPLERPVFALRILIGYALRAAHAGEGLENAAAVDAARGEHPPARARVGDRREEEVLRAHVLVVQGVGLAEGFSNDLLKFRGWSRLGRPLLETRHRGKRLLDRGVERLNLHAHLLQDRNDHALFLPQKRSEKVNGRRFRVILSERDLLRRGDRLLRLDREAIEIDHDIGSFAKTIRPAIRSEYATRGSPVKIHAIVLFIMELAISSIWACPRCLETRESQSMPSWR